MKKTIIVILALLITNIAFALDTDLGKVSLTKNQVSHLSDLYNENIKGFSYWFTEEKLVVVTLNTLSKDNKTQLIEDALALPDTALPVVKTDIEVLQDKVTSLETKMTKAETDITNLKK